MIGWRIPFFSPTRALLGSRVVSSDARQEVCPNTSSPGAFPLARTRVRRCGDEETGPGL